MEQIKILSCIIKALYQQNYNFTCSSQNCPSREGGTSNQIDIVDDMTLHYFPCDEHCSEKVSKENEKFDGEKSPLGNTPSVKVSPDSISSDFLLSQAISRIEIEKENIYEKPKGKSYRRAHTNIKKKLVSSSRVCLFHPLQKPSLQVRVKIYLKSIPR